MSGVYILQHALQDYARLRRLMVWIIIAIALFGVTKAFLYVSPVNTPRDAYALMSSILVFRLLPLASAIFSTAVVSQEVEQKTIVYLLTRPVLRGNLLLFRTLASMLIVAAIGSLSAFSVSLATFGSGALANDLFYKDLSAIVVGAAAYGALFVFISLLINRAMIICLLFAFAWETSVSSMPGDIYKLSINSYLTAISQRPTVTEGGPLGALSGTLFANTISVGTAWPVMILLIGACLWLGRYWFSNFEYVPREDAE